jgi:pSer/pThr/pTyr-binding forkhead associated (FHA) protein
VAQDKSRLDMRSGRPDNRSGGSPLYLLLQIGDERTKTVKLQLSERILIGRAGTDGEADEVDLDLTAFGAGELGVSRVHAAILYKDKELHLEDLGSTNGTRINGLQIPPLSPYLLRNDDELEFGRLRVCVRLVRAPG